MATDDNVFSTGGLVDQFGQLSLGVVDIDHIHCTGTIKSDQA
jgi:hypothetical protein